MGRAGRGRDRTAVGLTLDYPNDLWDIYLSYRRIGHSFDPSLGFVPRKGIHDYRAMVTWLPRPDWGWLRYVRNELCALELSGTRNVGDLPQGRFVQELVGTRVRLNVSPDLQPTSFSQYDNESKSVGSNTRLRWTFDPRGDLFAVYNRNLQDLGDRSRRDSNQLLVKIRYAVRR